MSIYKRKLLCFFGVCFCVLFVNDCGSLDRVLSTVVIVYPCDPISKEVIGGYIL